MSLIGNIRTRFTADFSDWQRRTREARGLLTGLDRAAGRVRGLIGRAFSPIAGIGSLVAGGGFLAGFAKLIDVNREAENLQLNIGGLIQSASKATNGPFKDFTLSQEAAAAAIREMRKEAATTPATLEDVAGAFQNIVFLGMQAGAPLKQITSLAGKIATIGGGGQGSELLSRDVMQILKGQGSTTQIGNVQLQTISEQAAKLAKEGNKAAALTLIESALEVDDKLREAFGNSFEGVIATAKDQLKEMALIAGEPVFAQLKGVIIDAAAWMRENRELAQHWATIIGEQLVDGFKAFLSGVHWLIENREEIVWWAKMIGQVYLGTIAVSAIAQITLGLIKFIGILKAGSVTAFLTNPIWAAVAALGAAIALMMNAEAASNRVASWLEEWDPLGITGGRAIKRKTMDQQKLELDAHAERVRQVKEQEAMARDRERAIKEQAAAEKSILNAVPAGNIAAQALEEAKKATRGSRGRRAPEIKIDARGMRIEQTIHYRDESPVRVAGGTLKTAMTSLLKRTTSGKFGLGSIPLATGG